MASPEQTSDYVAGGKPLTGRKVLLMVLAFFGVVMTVNLGILLPNAIKTFRGIETPSAYRASQDFNENLAIGAAQAARGWDVEAHVVRGEDGVVTAEITTRDRDGKMLAPMDGEAMLARPADRRMDLVAPIELVGYGSYQARFEDVAAGQWDIVLSFMQDGERVFHSRNRIILR
jgi:nitrogen fixation protein FixH